REWRFDAGPGGVRARGGGGGKDGRGGGRRGVAPALMARGGRGVGVVRWEGGGAAPPAPVIRCFGNPLGRRGPKAPSGRAGARAEAKKWLRELPRGEAEKRLAGVAGGEVRAKAVRVPVVVKGKPAATDRPFAHPSYWAAFVLIGDPD